MRAISTRSLAVIFSLDTRPPLASATTSGAAGRAPSSVPLGTSGRSRASTRSSPSTAVVGRQRLRYAAKWHSTPHVLERTRTRGRSGMAESSQSVVAGTGRTSRGWSIAAGMLLIIVGIEALAAPYLAALVAPLWVALGPVFGGSAGVICG